jgi:hypothetical protein
VETKITVFLLLDPTIERLMLLFSVTISELEPCELWIGDPSGHQLCDS